MKTLAIIFKSSIIALILVLTSCSAEDGVDGINGINGANGVQGVTGVTGATGNPGQDGNANVVSVLFENQTLLIGDNVFDIPELTQEIFDTGLVHVYATRTGSSYWEILPISSGGQIVIKVHQIRVGRVILRTTEEVFDVVFKFILVEGN